MSDDFSIGGKEPLPPLTGMTRRENADGIRDHVMPDAPPKYPKTEAPKLDLDEADASLEIPAIPVGPVESGSAGAGSGPEPVESVLDDISTEFGGHRIPADLVGQLSYGLQRSMFIDRQTALAFAYAFAFSLGGFALFEQVAACTR